MKKQEICSERKVCYTIGKVSQELLNSITTHSFLNDSEGWRQDWWPVCPIPLFFMADGSLVAERGLSGAHCLSLSLIRKQQVGSQKQEKKHHHLLYESLTGPLLTITYSQHTRNEYICTDPAYKQTLPQLHQPYRNRAVVFTYWWLPAGVKGTDRCSSPIKCQTRSNSRRMLKAAAQAFVFLFIQNFLWVMPPLPRPPTLEKHKRDDVK